MAGAVGFAVAVVLMIGVVGVALFVAGRRGHVRRESIQLAATIAGLVGVLLTGVALIFDVTKVFDVTKDDSPSSAENSGQSAAPLLPNQAEYKRFDGPVSITDRRLDIDRTPPARVGGRNDLYLDPSPKGIRAVKPAKIVGWNAPDTPEQGDCRALVGRLDLEEGRIIIGPKVGDEFCVQTQGNDKIRYAFGRIEDVQSKEYKVKIFVWK